MPSNRNGSDIIVIMTDSDDEPSPPPASRNPTTFSSSTSSSSRISISHSKSAANGKTRSRDLETTAKPIREETATVNSKSVNAPPKPKPDPTPKVPKSHLLAGKAFMFRGTWVTMTASAAEELCIANGGCVFISLFSLPRRPTKNNMNNNNINTNNSTVVRAVIEVPTYIVIGKKGTPQSFAAFQSQGAQIISEPVFLDMILRPPSTLSVPQLGVKRPAHTDTEASASQNAYTNGDTGEKIGSGSGTGKQPSKKAKTSSTSSTNSNAKESVNVKDESEEKEKYISEFLNVDDYKSYIILKGRTFKAYDCETLIYTRPRCGKTFGQLLCDFETWLADCDGVGVVSPFSDITTDFVFGSIRITNGTQTGK